MAPSPADSALDAFRGYSRAFQTLSPEAVVPYFHQPAMMITPRHIEALSTDADIVRAYGEVMADARKRGYAVTEFAQLTEHRLGDDLALVAGLAIRKSATGEELDRVAVTYCFSRQPQSWRIVVATIHDPRKLLWPSSPSPLFART